MVDFNFKDDPAIVLFKLKMEADVQLSEARKSGDELSVAFWTQAQKELAKLWRLAEDRRELLERRRKWNGKGIVRVR